MTDAYTQDCAREDAEAEKVERWQEKREEQLIHVKVMRRTLKAGMLLTRFESITLCDLAEELLQEKVNG